MTRRIGRISGAWAPGNPTDAAGALQVDHDAATLDERPLAGVEASGSADPDGRHSPNAVAWREVLARGRLGDVRGAFALAQPGADGSLTLARDAIGERTLYHAPLAGGGVAFASTVPALLARGLVPRELDPVAVAAYLSCAYVPGERTLLASVKELLPGQVLTFPRGGGPPREERLWSLPPETDASDGDEEHLREELRAALELAVRRRLPPPGERAAATLSGGIDSSLVVALARRLHEGPLATYSVSFGPRYPNELEFSSLVARHCGTEHHVVEISAGQIVAHLDEAIALLGKPIGDPLTTPNLLLFREASGASGAVLNGEGGDPCFGGPKNVPMLLTELLGDGAEHGDPRTARERSYLRAHQKAFDDLPDLLEPWALEALHASPLEELVTPYFTDPRWRRFVTKLQAINVVWKGAHHILPKVDALSEPFGVVPRSPLFDRDVVELAFKIPPSLKLRGSVEKWLLKEAVRDVVPREIRDRPKSGMLVPVEGWFSGPLLPLARERLMDSLPRYGLVRRAWIERLLDGKLPGHRPRRGVKIWLLVTLESWLRAAIG